PPDLGHILREYRKVLVPEINSGQLVRVLRAEYLVDAVGFNRVRGLPLAIEEILDAINQLVESQALARAARRRRKRPSTRRRTSSPTRTFGGAPAAGTTRSSPRCRSRCRTWASRRRTSSSSPGSAARAASRTT